MEEDKKKPPRQPNQFRMLYSPDDLTEGAERLLELIKKYEFHENITNTQWGYLMGIHRRKVINYVNELIAKNRITVIPENRRTSGGKINKYTVVEQEDKPF